MYFVKALPACGKGILAISSVELRLSERLQITSLFHLPDTVSTFLPWVFMDVTCKAACNNAICPASDSSFSPPFITATCLWILAIFTCHFCAAEFRLQWAVSNKLCSQHKAHSPMWSQEELWPSVLWKSQVAPTVISWPPWIWSDGSDGSTCPQCFFLPWCICTSSFLFKLLSVSIYHAFDEQISLLKPAKWLICFCSLFTSTFLMHLCL